MAGPVRPSRFALIGTLLLCGCLTGDLLDDWDNADLRVTSETASVVGEPGYWRLKADFQLPHDVEFVRIAASYRSPNAHSFAIEWDSGGRNHFHSQGVQANTTVRDARWAEYDTLNATRYEVYLLAGGPAPAEGTFAVGLYWAEP